MNNDDKVAEILIEEFRLLRQEMREMRNDFHIELRAVNKDVNTLKTRFMLVAITMGVAGGKLSAIFPFLK